jgi:hypothetical protein
MFNQPALTTEETTEMLDMLVQTFEEGRFSATIGELTALIDGTRNEDGSEVFSIISGTNGGLALAFELYGKTHEVALKIRANPSGNTFTF